jgi:hypothetical protein
MRKGISKNIIQIIQKKKTCGLQYDATATGLFNQMIGFQGEGLHCVTL